MSEVYGTFAEADLEDDDHELEQSGLQEAADDHDALQPEASDEEAPSEHLGKPRRFLRSVSRSSVRSGRDEESHASKERSSSRNRGEEPLESARSRHSGASSGQQSEKDDFVKRMREMLRKVFQFYASFGNRCNSRYLKPSQFIKMMLDSDVADSRLNQTKLDILFLQACKRSKTLEFEDFLELLCLVASKKFGKEALGDRALSQLLTSYIEPLFKRIMNETDAGVEDQILNVPLSVSTLLLLRMVNKPLQAIYRYYFSWEVSRPLQEKPSMAKVEAELFQFLKEFEVCPQLVAKASAHSIYTQVLNTPAAELCKNAQYPDLERILGRDLGEMFTYFRFVVYLTRLGIFVFGDLNNVPSTHKEVRFTDEEKVYLLFERLDISGGLAKVGQAAAKDKAAGQTQHRLSLSRDSLLHIHSETAAYPHFFEERADDRPEPALHKVLGGKDSKRAGQPLEEEFMYIKMARQSSKARLSPRSQRGSASGSRKPRRTLLQAKANKENLPELANAEKPADGGPNLIFPESYDLCETYLDELHRVFEGYCSFGEPGNFTLMKAARFHKLVKDAGLLEKEQAAMLAQDVDIIFVSVLHGMNPFSTQSRKRAVDLLRKGRGEADSRHASPLKGKAAQKGLEFPMFLQCLEAVALLAEQGVPKQDRFRALLTTRVLPLASGRQRPASGVAHKMGEQEAFAARLMAVLRDKTLVAILGTLHKAVLPIYQLYCDDGRLLTAKKYVQFMKDFGVFPQVVSQARLLAIFHGLSALYRSKAEAEPREPSVDQHLFVEGLALAALEVDYDKFKLTHCQKLILLLERMNDSEATQKLSRGLGRTISQKFDFVGQVRVKFADQFKF
jgi:hypothetical protein